VNPLYLLFALLAGLLAAAWTRRVYPQRRLVAWSSLAVVASLGLLADSRLLWPLIGIDLVLLGVAVVDLVSVPRRKWLGAEREMVRVASLRKPHPVRLTISNRSRRALLLNVRDDVPDECDASPDRFALRVPPQSRVNVRYQLAARRRGAYPMKEIYLRGSSWLGLWQRDLAIAAPSELDVYPDMRQMDEYAILARTNRLSLFGLRRQRRIGQDNEFERLRDYTPDDNYKHIDWRSTARRGKLTVKDFQVNQSQRIIFLIDCGRMMTSTASGIGLLDHALNAALMLSYVALGKGDGVGLVYFADGIQKFVPPRGGRQQMNRLLHASFDRFATLVESRYDEAFVYLNSHLRKRSLVVLITNVIDEVNSHQVSQYLTNLVGHHLPLAVLLRDHAVFDAVQEAPRDDATLFRAAAAAEIIAWRRGVLADMSRQGVLALDVFPEQLTASLVNRYLEIKARHLL
jgi:uncharacterized protein (DUF58 family)